MTFVRPPVFATLLTLVGVAVLCTLGTWQVQRLAWKTAFLGNMQTEIGKDAKAFPITADTIPEAPESTFFMRGIVRGTFDYANEIFLGPKSGDGFFLNQVLTPLVMEGDAILLVQRGWVMEKSFEIAEINENRADQEEWVSGYIKRPHVNYWIHRVAGVENDPVHDRWHHINIDEIAAAKGLKNVLPVILYAEDASYTSDEWPKIEYQDVRFPNNNHLQYALFWFTMALSLLVVFALRFCIKKAS